jgi:purine-cytosine permease-like protein
MVMGAIVGSALNNKPEWAAANTAGVGFIVEKIIHPYGFAKFILFILVLSGIGMNCLSMYSAGLSLQQFARPMTIVPRFFWTLLSFVAIILLGLVGRQNLIGYLQNFLSFLGYFTTSYFIMVFSEHYIFRKGNFANYQLESWNDRSKMPIGIAGGFAFASGIVGCKYPSTLPC